MLTSNENGKRENVEISNTGIMEIIQNLKSELSNTVGNQIDKLGNIVERTVEEIEIKMEKLDQNFGYAY